MRYIAHGEVDTVSLKADYGPAWQGSLDIPEFIIEAASREQALELARQVIDPLHMTDTRITVEEAPRAPYRWALERELFAVIRLLRTGTAEKWLPDVLFAPLEAIAKTTAKYLGYNWAALMSEEKEEDAS